MKRKILSTILAVIMLVSIISTTALADGTITRPSTSIGTRPSTSTSTRPSTSTIRRPSKVISEVVITDYAFPYHGETELRTASTSTTGVKITGVQYVMYNKQIVGPFSEGDRLGIEFLVELEEGYSFADGAVAVIGDKKSDYSVKPEDVIIRFVFAPYTITANPEKKIDKIDFELANVFPDMALPSTLTSKTAGITAEAISWTPADENAVEGKTYKGKAKLVIDKTYVYAVDEPEVTVNGEKAVFTIEEGGGAGKVKVYHKYVNFDVTVPDADDVIMAPPNKYEDVEEGTIEIGKPETEPETEPETDDPETEPETEPETDDPETEPETEPEKPYVFPFTDVKDSDWFRKDVETANKNGLINGKSATIYAPYDNMTYAEAVKLAACMNQLYYDGEVTLVSGKDNWYSTYMTYCLDNGIIDFDLTAQANDKITRRDFVKIFYASLPASEFAKINKVADNAIPDVKVTDMYAKEIYTFYRAGILVGSSSAGTFNPESNIIRAEVAAILTRMFDATARKTITLE